MISLRPTRLQIDLEAIRQNLRMLSDTCSPAAILAVVKANAYGHGAIQTARAALEAGADMLAVALIEEGIELREAGIRAPVLMLGSTLPEAAEATVEYGITPVVFIPQTLRALEEAAKKRNRTVEAHVKIDTGMNRIGIRSREEMENLLDEAENCPHIRLTGALTHFAQADDPQSLFGEEQISKFEGMTEIMRRRGLHFERHAAASAAALRYPKARFDRVRAGIVMYGVDPLGKLPVQPAMRWSTEIAYVKTIEAGQTVSYGRHFAAKRPTRVATLPVGYADGYRRAFSNRAHVLIKGQCAPVLGSVCMDQIMVDVTDIPAQIGDEAVLLGRQGEQEVTAVELAELAGTIPYEIMTGISSRVPRFYEHE